MRGVNLKRGTRCTMVIYDPTQSPLEETASYILSDYTMSTFLNRMHDTKRDADVHGAY
jgi:hypothetical protein